MITSAVLKSTTLFYKDGSFKMYKKSQLICTENRNFTELKIAVKVIENLNFVYRKSKLNCRKKSRLYCTENRNFTVLEIANIATVPN